MKCPKCGYIGFEASDRCRNCGYDFALAPEPPAPADLPLRPGAPLGPLADLTLENHEEPPASLRRRPAASKTDFDFDRYEPPPPQARDLPLFEEAPLGSVGPQRLTPVPPARPPLAVRRSTPPPTRVRSRTPRSEQVNLDLKVEAPATPAPRAAGGAEAGTDAALPAGRAVAALIDALILVPIDLVVIYFTLRLCRLGLQDLTVLPAVPLLLFFLILDGGYLLAFTAAGGQTIGKMAMGLKVVGRDGDSPSAGRALVRTLAWIVSVAPLGLGLLPAAFDADRRALHDRVAGTRVVSLHAS
jgi:uncharacterized RDD family membrane protein YckC